MINSTKYRKEYLLRVIKHFQSNHFERRLDTFYGLVWQFVSNLSQDLLLKWCVQTLWTALLPGHLRVKNSPLRSHLIHDNQTTFTGNFLKTRLCSCFISLKVLLNCLLESFSIKCLCCQDCINQSGLVESCVVSFSLFVLIIFRADSTWTGHCQLQYAVTDGTIIFINTCRTDITFTVELSKTADSCKFTCLLFYWHWAL